MSAESLTYDPYHLLGEVIARLELQGLLPHKSVPKDIEAAVEASRALLTALGIEPVLVTQLIAWRAASLAVAA